MMTLRLTRHKYALLQCFLMVSALIICTPISADILVRFPKGFDIAQMSRIAKEIERETGIHSVGVARQILDETSESDTIPDQIIALAHRAKIAYKELNLELVLEILGDAENQCLSEASYESCRPFLFNVGMLRGMAFDALGNREAADQAFRSAHIADPSRVVDPRLYPPSILSAFAKACALEETIQPIITRLTSHPPGARFRLNGSLVLDPLKVPLVPGRHILEAHLLGFEKSRRIVEVPPTGTPPLDVPIGLAPMPQMDAWKSLVAHISRPDWQLDDPGLLALLERFKIEFIISLTRNESGTSDLEASLAIAKSKSTTSLPVAGISGKPLESAFLTALRQEIGLLPDQPAPPTPETKPQPQPEEGPSSEYEDHESDADEEDPSVRYTEEVNPESSKERSAGAKLLKSPWFWISIGTVAAIVAGVTVTTQVGD